MENGKIISLEGLIKRFPVGRTQFTALRGIDLTFGEGEFAGLVGPSGSGKGTISQYLGYILRFGG